MKNRRRPPASPIDRIGNFDILPDQMRAAMRQDHDAVATISQLVLAGRRDEAREYLDRLVRRDGAEYSRKPSKRRRL